MVDEDRDRMVLWPSNIDVERSRGEGRIVSLDDAVSSPKLSGMKEAAEKLGLNPVVEDGKAYPSFWWLEEGRVVVDKNKGKTEVAREIAGELKS
ncbi:Signal recognition particle 19 kDa protein SEC65 [Methanonatronarchaeum thermophilum]|uniref:Signal recognition particle 19 kDa protein n=1 Tax=Methanonatronarchaeum thermophilum TaxID=1927129 RepID=A0A1Y3GD66_9EURY|nr:signal recognition particle protein Srp19 [Methanonatronarchaeum thermophilum]OUJ19412.1 Signal recognition particle 19 kDa protein SEC65 [Methanonatronarchaeum thermophilum]